MSTLEAITSAFATESKEIPDNIKMRFMDMVVRLNADAPQKGIEMSTVRKAVCKPFFYPTPFGLHFSIAHLAWYQIRPEDYVAKMKETDKDLAAHFTIIFHKGKCLYGEAIQTVFEEPPNKYYFEVIPINYRPILIKESMETSYPSSTTLLVITVMPTLIEQVIVVILCPCVKIPLVKDSFDKYAYNRKCKRF